MTTVEQYPVGSILLANMKSFSKLFKSDKEYPYFYNYVVITKITPKFYKFEMIYLVEIDVTEEENWRGGTTIRETYKAKIPSDSSKTYMISKEKARFLFSQETEHDKYRDVQYYPIDSNGHIVIVYNPP